jgi:murein DD-endopeptidase MepM/ murein hydrolase activator NlpD
MGDMMVSVHEYKRLENKLVQRVKEAVEIAVDFIAGVFRAFGNFLTRRYTVVFVPHSEKKVYNFHVTILSISCFLLVVFGILGAFFWYGASYSSTMYNIASKDSQLQLAQASLDQFRDETANLMKEVSVFQHTFSEVLVQMGQSDRSNLSRNTPGDLSIFLNIDETPEGGLREINNIKWLTNYFSQTSDPMRQLVEVLSSQSALLTEIPSIWPVKGGIGNISMFFGQNINPIHGHYYIHRGIDIATHRSGDPVVATADGHVVTAEYRYDFGNYVIIRHKHGYYTRYAHLQRYSVSVGQRVQQNEVIGWIGSTGISTGPHLHYEVHIGSDVVDPYRYITIRSSMARGR